MTPPIDESDLAALISQFEESDLTELHVKTGEFEVFIASDANAAAPWDDRPAAPAAAKPAPAPSSVPTPASDTGATDTPSGIPEGHVAVRAPYLGTFYRAPKPGEQNFVEIGDTVEPGADLCLVEVMKLFTAVRADVRGVVRHVYAVDGQMVQEGQPLFALEPAA